MKIRVEISIIKTKETILRNIKPKSLFLEKIKEMERHLIQEIKRKKGKKGRNKEERERGREGGTDGRTREGGKEGGRKKKETDKERTQINKLRNEQGNITTNIKDTLGIIEEDLQS